VRAAARPGAGDRPDRLGQVDHAGVDARPHQHPHRSHIITIEDPIEFLHPHKNCLVNQREVGGRHPQLRKALRHILRQDPDVVLIGEMRDLETIEAALTIAETGHLCLATLHTTSAIGSINRIIDVFPAHQQPQIRQVLSFVLEGVISQTLVPRASGTGQVLAAEVMIPTQAIRNLIREDKLHQVYSQMQIGQSKHGMQTLNQSLCDLFLRRLITLEDAMARSADVDELKNLIASGGALDARAAASPGQRRAKRWTDAEVPVGGDDPGRRGPARRGRGGRRGRGQNRLRADQLTPRKIKKQATACRSRSARRSSPRSCRSSPASSRR
jgi:hypothetical protein